MQLVGTLGNNTFTLKADSTDTTAQALNKSGGLAFKVAGDGDLSIHKCYYGYCKCNSVKRYIIYKYRWDN